MSVSKIQPTKGVHPISCYPCDNSPYFPVKPEVYLRTRCYCACGSWIAALLSTIGNFKLCPLNHPTLLHADKEAAERLSKTVDEACLLLAEYNGRLAAELEDRRQLARMLIEYTQNQKDVLTEKEKKLEVSACCWGWQNNWLTKRSPWTPHLWVSPEGRWFQVLPLRDSRCCLYIVPGPAFA